jgi:hypothetical protein
VAEEGQDDAPGEPAPGPGPGTATEPEPVPEAAQPGGDSPETGSSTGPGPRTASAEAAEDRQDTSIINNFYSHVSAGTIGASGAGGAHGRPSVSLQSGLLPIGSVRNTLRYFLAPAPFDRTLQALRRRRLVALAGPEGWGKRAATLKLASEICPGTETYSVLPPTRSLPDLAADKGYRPGQVYLLHDWVPDVAGGSTSATRYALEQLESRLQERDAYLAITFQSAGSLSVLLHDDCVQWSVPEPTALLDHCIRLIEKLRPTDEEYAQLRATAEELRLPKLIIKMAEAAADDIESALADAQDGKGSAVTAWFNDQPARWKVWSVTALTFMSGVGERKFERMLTGLTRIAHADRRPDVDDRQPEVDDEEQFRQDRWQRDYEAGLEAFIIKRDPLARVGTEHRPAIRTIAFRQHFMLELNRRFGDDLWTPVRHWLFAIADQPFGEAQIAAGYGLALLARCALGEVEDTYLTPWSAGDLRHRLMAVSVLWSMAEDEEMAAAAMGIAVGWVHNRGPGRAITAALALSGPLGQQHPLEAMRWLWTLALRGERIGLVARTAMSHLFSVETELEEARSRVPRFLLLKIRPMLSGDVTPRERRAALAVVNAVLAATQTTGELPVLATSLRDRPADVEPVGELWAAVLNSVQHRADAIRSLRATLTAMPDDSGAEELAAQLGAVILPRLSPRAHEVLAAKLRDPYWAEDVSAAVLAAFLRTQRRVLGAIQ